jgi:predicted RNA binding protein YcfA (HicA-like mRNA interferase family)
MPKLSPVSYKQLVKVFEAEGFRCVRIEGDHMHDKELQRGNRNRATLAVARKW